MDPVTTAVVGWATSQAGSAGSRGIKRLLLGDPRQNALASIVRHAIGTTVQTVVDADDQELVRDALQRDLPDTNEIQIKDMLRLPTAVLSHIRPRLEILAEQGFVIDLDRLAKVLVDQISEGIQANAASGGTLADLAKFLQDERTAVAAEETAKEMRAVSRTLQIALTESLLGSDAAPGPYEAAGQVARILLAVDNICMGRPSMMPSADDSQLNSLLKKAIATAAACDSRPPQAMIALQERIDSHGLDPRLLIPQLSGHHEALRQWQDSANDTNMSERLERLRGALAEQICASTDWNLSDSARKLLMEAMTKRDDRSSRLFLAFISELERRLPPLRSGSREAVLAGHQEQNPIASTDPRASMASLYARTMHQLPPRDPYLTGRDEQIQLVVNEIARVMTTRKSAVAFLSGQPGVGTSTIAIEAARALSSQFLGGVLYFDLQGLEERARLTPSKVASAILKALDVPDTPAIGGSGIWGSQGDLYNAYAAALKGRQVLLLLDNALDASHVAPLLASRASSCCVVVTSRDRDQGFADPGLVFPIDVLYRAASIDLLSQIARDRDGKTPSSETFFPLCAELAQLCDDVPLALRLVAAQVSSRPEAEVAERLQYLVTRLQAESTRLDRMRSGERAVRAAIRLSYLNLDDGTRRLLRLSCTARGSGITGDELGYCLELDTDIVEDGLNRLVDRSLAMQVTRQHGYSTPHVSFGLFELVRLFADERRSDEETAEIITEVRRRFTMYMHNRLVAIDRDPSDPDLSATLDPAAMLTALQLADEFDWTDLGLELAQGLCSHLDPSTEPDRLQLAYEIHISLYLRSGNVSNAILTYLRYAALLKDVGRTTEAAESARSARALATQHELVDLVAEANFQLSLLAAVQEEWAEALEASETAAGTLLQHAKPATALPSAINCCRFARNLDDYGRALHWAKTAVDLADRAGGPSQRADASFELGMSSDDNQEIFRAFNKARSLYEQVGNFSNAAVAAENAARNTSNQYEMIEFLRIATELWKRTEHVTRLATSLVAMSAALTASHNLTDAAVALNEAIRELTADDTDEGLIHDDVAPRLLLEIRARYVALQLLLGTRVPGDVKDFDNSERVEEAQLTVEIAVLRDLCHGAKASWGALDMLRSFVSQEPKNPAHPFSAWWYDELGTEPSGRPSLESM